MATILTPAQKEIAKDSHRFRVVNCGRRFGKTTVAVEEMIACAGAKDDTMVAYIAPTYQQARDIAWEMLKRTVRPVADNINESRLEITIKSQDGGKSKIFLRGWESVESLRGQKFHFLVLDEVAMMRNFWSGWEEVLRPALTDTRGSVLFISTPKGFNHFYDLYNKRDNDYKSFHYTTYDNPYLPKDEIDKARTEIPEDRFAQEYLADFRKVEGLVYKEFNREYDLFENKQIQTKQIICGLDFGFTNPTAILKIEIDRDDTYWITEEWYKTGQTTEQIVEVLHRMKPTAVYPDPAEPDRILILQQNGVNVREVSKDIVAGIDRVRELFKQRRIKIHKSCINLISELETYCYPEKMADKNEPEKPIKEHDHALDALRYALYTIKPIQANPFSGFTKQPFV
jgi:PBSX family phage terminase large subunit